jgi:hypothetical protein
MKIISIIIVALAFVLVFISMGCSRDDLPDEDTGVELPAELGLMQGSWKASSANGCTEDCNVVIDGYTIRIRYQETPDSTVVRQSVVVDRLDEQKKLLLLNGGKGAWNYLYGITNGQEHLELNLFSRHHMKWKKLYLKRTVGM